MPRIPFSSPDIGEEEIQAVVSTLRSGWVTTGPETARFEEEFARRFGDEVEAIAVNSATAGLHLALEACGVGPGDEVIVPAWTFTATAEVVRYLGATPVIADVTADSLNIDIDKVLSAVTARTRAIIPVHFAGLSVDVRALRTALGGEISIIEDAAHALPSEKDGVAVGSCLYSDATVFSFYANKTMTTGEGGMITTRRGNLAKRARVMRLHGIDRDVFDRYSSTRPSWAYDVIAPGYKYNLTDSASAMGRVQLRRIDQMQQRREEISNLYFDAFSSTDLTLPRRAERGEKHSWHLFVLRLPKRIERDTFIERLSERGVGSSVHFIPLHLHSYWRSLVGVDGDAFPVSSSEFKKAVSIPLFSKMTDSQVNDVISNVTELLA
ncbi:DegT/DnrJ/EryC1/StrS family aminotransferase [Paramicrobacterium fandaimingii]|uniref:DegT/DnrJ/EryC1/StrS family aminotransferase n=1 Tax=Paramicrobacterium fandaimingii TaxID=2708079 RepID=UPI0014223E3B|nr:DegT/DnrJ/EryC1/StrS aminotransferase family protein [Microbacterium fandaimingii]